VQARSVEIFRSLYPIEISQVGCILERATRSLFLLEVRSLHENGEEVPLVHRLVRDLPDLILRSYGIYQSA
jgi:hypothetical protein